MDVISYIVQIGWLVFWIYWFISAFGSKKNRAPRSKFIWARLLIFVIAIIVIRLNLTNNSQSLRHLAAIHHNPIVQLIGLLLFIIGLALAIWARVNLGKNWGMPMSLKVKPDLITSGPYKYIRHPIYTGILLAAAGSAMAVSFIWITVVIIAGIYFIYSAYIEERILMNEFPKDFPIYKAKTKMLIPLIF